ncbi:hypothetical protein PVAND_003681 [Polypedilum vanderplanki]|uniref:Uncharacterized protein n=1 Tax=Polypedilum vanderplanki TaxID=319348 RepID=A0A9J6BVW4_POLVA|nr:hypothetical protein PVAND_003681 [Polypedilum vanderplanki]
MPKNKIKINVKEKLEDNVLDLSLSEIDDIPIKDIAAVKRATVLDLSSNNIKFLPKNFGTQLSHLHRLDLSKNQLRFLPDDFGNLVNLKHLDLYNNYLEQLPVTFGKLTKLKYLDLKGNPLSLAVQKVVGPCLSNKDCQEAARKIVPYYVELGKKIEIEMRKKAEREAKQRELEAEKQREEKRLAKKAARKERVILDRQRKAKEKTFEENHNNENDGSDDKTLKIIKNKSLVQSFASMNLMKSIKFVLLITMLFIMIYLIFYKFSLYRFDAILSLLPDNERQILNTFFHKFNESIKKFLNSKFIA